MTLKDVAYFIFPKYPAIDVKVMAHPTWVEGKYHTIHDVNDFKSILEPWFDNEVIEMCFQTHYTNSVYKEISKCKRPILYILINNEQEEKK